MSGVDERLRKLDTKEVKKLMQVLKRNGSEQPFDKSKIAEAVKSAGGTEEESVRVADKIESWAVETAVNNQIASTEILSKVRDELTTMNPEVATKFQSFVKTP
jgi:transcriptional regulator NrdR family protein